MELSSFKAPWRSGTALEAFQTTGLYEAGANVLWLDPGLTETEGGVPLEEPTWQTLVELSQYFRERVAEDDKGGSGGVTPWPVAYPSPQCLKAMRGAQPM